MTAPALMLLLRPILETENARPFTSKLALLALALASVSHRYRKGDDPNSSKIAEAVTDILDALPDAKRQGTGSSSIRASIKAGLDLLSEA
ncbi:hypothetical protein DF045_23050 [Burkholderia cepacia]|nr:hypothetical protein DF045_23050 [Burkholderia cepacia]